MLEAIRELRDRLDRRPHHVAVAAAAVGLGLAAAPRQVALAVLAAATALLLALCLPRRAALAAIAGVAALACGSARLAAIDRGAYAGPPGTAVSGRAVVLEQPRPSRFGSSAVVRMTSGRAAGVELLARVSGRMRWPDGGEVGTIVFVAGSAKAPGSGGSFDWAAYLRRRGIRSELNIDALRPTGSRRGGVLGAVDSLRRHAEGALATGLSPGAAAVARGMVLGEDGAIGPLERDDFRRAGLAHVLSASGQNAIVMCELARLVLDAGM